MSDRILVLGSINLDYTATVGRLPAPGETIIGGELVVAEGGKGANQAVAAARAGAGVAFLGCVGDDDGGRGYLKKLAAEGVKTAFVRTVPGVRTGTALIFVEAGTGENMIAACPEANGHLSPADVEAARPAFLDAALVLSQLESPLDAVQHAAQMAVELGHPFLLNPSPVPPDGIPARIIELTSLLICNTTEIAQIATSLGEPHEESALRRLLAGRARAVIITRGAQGCSVHTRQESYNISAFKIPPVDAVGAGDAFTGAFAAAWVGGQTLRDCVWFATAAGALAATKHGAMPSLPDRNAIEHLLATG
jgi:ribokinase